MMETNIKRIDIDRAYEAGAASRQVEIDELKSKLETAEKNLNNAFKTIKFEQQHQDELQNRIDELDTWVKWNIEDYNLSESDSEHDRGWFNAACQVFKILKGESE